MSTECPDAAKLKELLDGSLPQAEQCALSAHLESCAACQQAIEALAAGRDTWAGAADQLGQPNAGIAPALAQVMERARHTGQSDAGDAGHETQAELPPDFLAPPDTAGNLGKLAHYEVLEVVGRGAMGIVMRAFDQKLHRVVAIKVMSPQLATSASARRRFIREGQAAAAVCHEHVVTIHAVEEARGLPYLVMQYVGGVSLQDRIDRTGPLQLREILRIGLQAAHGLAAAHAQGLVHRDIKPSNILLENGVERVKITDFGLARAVDDASLTQTGVVAGTPQYMAPEQARGDAVDSRADLFSLGSVLYALCAGRPPFRASSMLAVMKRVCEEAPRPIREINSEIPDWLEAIVEKLHAKNPAARFQSAEEVGELLGQHLAHLQQPDRHPRPAAAPLTAAAEPHRPPQVAPITADEIRWRRMLGILTVGASFVAAYLLDAFVVVPNSFFGWETWALFTAVPAMAAFIAWRNLVHSPVFVAADSGRSAVSATRGAPAAPSTGGALVRARSVLQSRVGPLVVYPLLGALIATIAIVPRLQTAGEVHQTTAKSVLQVALAALWMLSWTLIAIALLQRIKNGTWRGSLLGFAPSPEMAAGTAGHSASEPIESRGRSRGWSPGIIPLILLSLIGVPALLGFIPIVAYLSESKPNKPIVPARGPTDPQGQAALTRVTPAYDSRLVGDWTVVRQDAAGRSHENPPLPEAGDPLNQWIQATGGMGTDGKPTATGFADWSIRALEQTTLSLDRRGDRLQLHVDIATSPGRIDVFTDRMAPLLSGHYWLDDDRLIIYCGPANPPARRPTAIPAAAADGFVLHELKRNPTPNYTEHDEMQFPPARNAMMRHGVAPAANRSTINPRGVAGDWKSDCSEITLSHGFVVDERPITVKGSYVSYFTNLEGERGELDGVFHPASGVLESTWREPQAGLSGTARHVLSPDGNRLDGGYGDPGEARNTRSWNMTRIDEPPPPGRSGSALPNP